MQMVSGTLSWCWPCPQDWWWSVCWHSSVAQVPHNIPASDWPEVVSLPRVGQWSSETRVQQVVCDTWRVAGRHVPSVLRWLGLRHHSSNCQTSEKTEKTHDSSQSKVMFKTKSIPDFDPPFCHHHRKSMKSFFSDFEMVAETSLLLDWWSACHWCYSWW